MHVLATVINCNSRLLSSSLERKRHQSFLGRLRQCRRWWRRWLLLPSFLGSSAEPECVRTCLLHKPAALNFHKWRQRHSSVRLELLILPVPDWVRGHNLLFAVQPLVRQVLPEELQPLLQLLLHLEINKRSQLQRSVHRWCECYHTQA